MNLCFNSWKLSFLGVVFANHNLSSNFIFPAFFYLLSDFADGEIRDRFCPSFYSVSLLSPSSDILPSNLIVRPRIAFHGVLVYSFYNLSPNISGFTCRPFS